MSGLTSDMITLRATFKSSGWLERRNTQEGIENAATKDELSEAEESLITTFNVSVEETAESILSTVGTTVSDLEGELRSFVGSQIEQTDSTWGVNFENLARDVGENQDEISAMSSWFNVINDDGNIYLELGRSSTANKIRIYTDRISFLSGDSEVAYISDQTLRITQGIFVESAQIGKHRISTVDGTDFTSVNYVGGGD